MVLLRKGSFTAFHGRVIQFLKLGQNSAWFTGSVQLPVAHYKRGQILISYNNTPGSPCLERHINVILDFLKSSEWHFLRRAQIKESRISSSVEIRMCQFLFFFRITDLRLTIICLSQGYHMSDYEESLSQYDMMLFLDWLRIFRAKYLLYHR